MSDGGDKDQITARDAKNVVEGGTKLAEGGGRLLAGDVDPTAIKDTLEGAKQLAESAPKVAKKGAQIQAGCCLGLLIFAIGFVMPLTACLFSGSGGCDIADALENQTAGVATSKPLTKEEWVEVYKYAGNLMRIEWEFLAAITKQETGMGNNFGKCSYYAPAPSGGHVLVDGNGLRSTKDLTAFTEIMNKLSLPMNTAVSCNPSGSNGGAMGYTQFMPREWQGGANASMLSILGHYPNPWNATDATVMAGQLLKAKVGIGTSEAMPVSEEIYRRAASKYYGDGNPNGRYASSVYAFYLQIKRDQHL